MITDGQANVCAGGFSCSVVKARDDAAIEAAAARAAGIEIYAIGVGSDVDANYLTDKIAGDPSRYFSVEKFDKLETTLLTIARILLAIREVAP
jgi:hypothetical protein